MSPERGLTCPGTIYILGNLIPVPAFQSERDFTDVILNYLSSLVWRKGKVSPSIHIFPLLRLKTNHGDPGLYLLLPSFLEIAGSSQERVVVAILTQVETIITSHGR